MIQERNKLFSYKNCSFAWEKEKENTARIVLFKELGIANWYTLEASFYGGECLGKVVYEEPIGSSSESQRRDTEENDDNDEADEGEDEEEEDEDESEQDSATKDETPSQSKDEQAKQLLINRISKEDIKITEFLYDAKGSSKQITFEQNANQADDNEETKTQRAKMTLERRKTNKSIAKSSWICSSPEKKEDVEDAADKIYDQHKNKIK